MRINDMINNSEGRKKEILQELKKLNKQAYLIMMAPFQTFGMKYSILQKTNEWRKAKQLLKEYFQEDGILRCQACGRVLTGSFTIHHDFYNHAEIFTPDFIKIIDSQCHGRIHKKVR